MAILDAINNFALGFTGQRPVFFNGKKIGFYKDLKELCRGTIYLYSDAPRQSDASKWTTKDDLWRDVPVSAYCVSNGIKPVWLTPEQTDAIKSANPAINIPVLPAESNDLPSIIPAVPLPDNKDLLKYGLIGGAGLVAVLLLLRR